MEKDRSANPMEDESYEREEISRPVDNPGARLCYAAGASLAGRGQAP